MEATRWTEASSLQAGEQGERPPGGVLACQPLRSWHAGGLPSSPHPPSALRCRGRGPATCRPDHATNQPPAHTQLLTRRVDPVSLAPRLGRLVGTVGVLGTEFWSARLVLHKPALVTA